MPMSRTFRLGVFIVATLLIFAATVFWIGEKQYLFHSTYRLQAEFQNVAGLNGGAEVRVGGIHEGTVRQIQLPMRPNEKVRVLMDMEKPTRSVIKHDSVATIQSEGLVGDKFVEISFGSDKSPKVKDGDTIQGQPPLQISDLLNKTSEVLDTTKGAIDNVNQTASNLNSITTKINQGEGSIGALINDKKIYQNVNAGTNAFKEDMEALKHNFFLRGLFKERGYESAADLKRNEISQLPGKPAYYAAPDSFAARNARRSRILIPESSSEIISSGVTPTCWPKRTNFSTACFNRSVSLSSKTPERLRGPSAVWVVLPSAYHRPTPTICQFHSFASAEDCISNTLTQKPRVISSASSQHPNENPAPHSLPRKQAGFSECFEGSMPVHAGIVSARNVRRCILSR